MKVYDTPDIRNVAIIGHGSTGKTTFAEAAAYTAGAVKRMGTIEDGNTRSDYLEDEISRQISISAALLQLEWNGKKVNFVDTPGYADFIGEVICGLRVTDSAAVFIDALSGLEVGTETTWDLCEKAGKPVFFVVNRIGKEHADPEKVKNDIIQRFGVHALPVQIPVNPGVGYNKIVDVISMKEYTYEVDGNGKGSAADITDNKEQAEELHEKLIEAAAESDDSLMEKFFESGLSAEEVSAGLKKGIQNRTLYPIVFVDSLTNVGADLVLNLITGSIPSPEDMPGVTGQTTDGEIELASSGDGPLAIQVFKTVVEQHVGELSLFRVFSGTYSPGNELYNANEQSSEKPTLIHNLVGKDRVDVPEVKAGDIGTFVKLKTTSTGDTLCTKSMQMTLPPLEFPEPVMDVAVYPATKGEEDKVAQGLSQLTEEDPSFNVRNDPELKQIILEGQGGQHIDIIIDRLKKKMDVDVVLKAPKIPYRETITGTADEKYRYKKQTGGRGQYGEVYFKMEPMPRGEGFEFVDEIKGGVIPSRFIPAVEKGLHESMVEGPLTHSKVIDLRVRLYYGSYHSVDSSEMAFKMAASLCFKEAFMKSNPILLEPIYTIEVKVPDDYTGDVMGDLSSRRGKIMGMEPMGVFQIVKAQVPLAELYQYATNLRSLTHGRGAYSRTFSHYEMVPSDIAKKVIEAAQEEEE